MLVKLGFEDRHTNILVATHSNLVLHFWVSHQLRLLRHSSIGAAPERLTPRAEHDPTCEHQSEKDGRDFEACNRAANLSHLQINRVQTQGIFISRVKTSIAFIRAKHRIDCILRVATLGWFISALQAERSTKIVLESAHRAGFAKGPTEPTKAV